MRVIAGTFKGRRLRTPDWEGVRPTSDRLRETLFNVLAPWIDGARFLDAYAGTGAVGIEALSRGAEHVTFVERDRRAQQLIAKNLDGCGIRDRHEIVRGDFTGSVPLLAAPFDVLFLDPPYGAAEMVEALNAAAPLVAADGLLVIEHARRDQPPERAGDLVRSRQLPSGDSALAFYRPSPS